MPETLDDRNARDAHLYRLAQAHKMIRLGLVRIEDGRLVQDEALVREMDSGPIKPDWIDIEAVSHDQG